MIQIILIAIGGAIGAVARYGVNTLAMKTLGYDFPYHTLIANILGCLLLGLLISTLAHLQSSSEHLRAFLSVGLLGAFTTFSTFSLDTITLFHRGALIEAGLYVLGNVVVGLLAVWVGLSIGRLFG